MDKKMREALQYFKQEKGYHSLFLLFRQKYESLGRFGGSIDVTMFSDHEIEVIALFMGFSPHHLLRKGKLMVADFEQRLQRTRFEGISLHELLESYFGEPVESKKAKKELLTAAQTDQLTHLKNLYPQLADWFTYLEGKTSDTHWIWRRLLEPEFATNVGILAEAYASLPDSMERYPLFSQRVTGDPHALDLATERGKLWLHLLHVMAGGTGTLSTNTESVNDLLHVYHLIRDDIQNFVTQGNLLAFSGGQEHSVWKAAVNEQSVMNVPLRELLKIDRVTTAKVSPKVYVVENSGVFSALLDEVPDAPLLCTHGQFKLAGLQLMDMLAEAGHNLCYSGDFDPEGLSMAIRFKERYGEQAQLWRMTVADYKQSDPGVELGNRDVKLSSLFDTELRDVALAIRETGKIGYQEGIMPLLVHDLQSKIKT